MANRRMPLSRMQDSVVRKDAAACERATFGEGKADSMSGIAEGGDSGAEEDGMDVQTDLIDEIRGEERLCEFASAHEADLFSRTLPEVEDEFGRVGGYECHAWCIDRWDCAREDIGAHGWLFGFAGFGLLRLLSCCAILSDRYLIGLSSHQDGVDILPIAGHDFLDVSAEMQPVDGAVGAGEESVEADGAAVGDRAQGVLSHLADHVQGRRRGSHRRTLRQYSS